MFDDWMERYEYIIELGKKLPLIKEEFKTKTILLKAANQSVAARRTSRRQSALPRIVMLY
jgi:hypothetical protein